ncbi:hypothetical protein HYT91_01750 [Candidatus Pacearchaeota archaeon]|nr:hypothetical protein [Candidatus Pacearchaeota archaeon]
MKKSTVIISFAFIFLLSVSFVSASWFSELFSGKTSGSAIKLGQDQNLQTVQKVKDCGFFCNLFGGEPETPPLDEPIPIDINEDVELNGNDFIDGCEVLDLEALSISPGNVGVEVLNNRFIDFDDDEVLTIDETFSTQLKEGNSYLVPIPNQQCYWEASYEKGELYMVTVCPALEEIVE